MKFKRTINESHRSAVEIQRDIDRIENKITNSGGHDTHYREQLEELEKELKKVGEENK